MGTPQQKYKIRPGTVDSGKEYETKITALLSLHCLLHGVDEMWIASNADGIGAFDDIILHVKTTENESITFMMQLKHKENGKNIQEKEFLNQKGDFSLNSYFQDISKLEQSISSSSKPQIANYLDQFDNIYFVFFTNRGVYENSEILKNVNEPDGSICFLNDVLNTNTAMNSLFGFNLENLPETASNNNFINVFLLANQLSFKHIDRQIAERIKEIVDPSGLNQVDVQGMAQNFMQFIKDWARGTLGGHYCLTKQDVLAKISDLFLTHYAVNLRQYQFNFYDCNKKHIWNQIMCHETITVVDLNDVVLEFLVKYIGSEVRKYCEVSNDNFWFEKLPDQAQTLFYQTNQDFKEQMLKIVGNLGKLTSLDVYKCLWMVNKLPLLLKVKRIQDYENILHVLKITNYSFKVIVINDSTVNLPCNQTGTKTFFTFQDLHFNYKDIILKLPIKLQGRAGVALENVIDENMYHYIKCNDIINILLDNFNIGSNLEQLPAYFIERSFIKIFFKAQVLLEIEGDIFLLDNRSDRYASIFPQNDFNACKLNDVDYNNIDNYKVILREENDGFKEIEKLKATRKTIHHLFIHDVNYLEWQWTLGSTRKLGTFQIQLEGMYQKDLTTYFVNVVNIVSDGPGMGKTTLMNFIEHQAPTDKWVLKINLNKHQQYYRKGNCKNSKSNAQKHLRYFNDLLSAEDSCNIELYQKVFNKFLHAKNIIVLMDGFDEISVSYKDEVTELAKCLCTEGYHIWLTTRPHMKSHLEENFDAFTFTLKPFDLNDQKLFFTKYFNVVNYNLVQQNPKMLLRQFVEQLLEASKENLRDEDAKFAGIPLQSKLLADFFNNDCKTFLNSKGAITFNKHFDLLDLYQNFIDKKFDILFQKFGENTVDTHSMFRKHQFLFALKFIFSSSNLEQLDIENEFNNDYKKELKATQLLQRDGIIMVDEKLNVSCTHRTFAEYLAALWLTENLNSASEKVKETVDILTAMRFSLHFEFLFRIFDQILTKHHPLHSAILNYRTDEIINAIRRNPDILKDVDDGNRSVLHIIALYSKRFPLHYDIIHETFIKNQEYNTDCMLDVINTVPNGVILDIKMDVLGYSPFDYALAYGSLTVANKLHNILESPILKPYKRLYLTDACLTYCAKLNYKKLFEILLPYFVSRDVLLNEVSRDSNITTYIVNQWSFTEHENFKSYVKELYNNKHITLLKLLHSADGYPYTGYMNNFYSDLRHAVISGTVENVKKLLSEGQNVNEKDLGDYRLLHYAILHKKIRNTEILIDNGADVNAQIFSNETPLHLTIDKNELGSKKVHNRFNASDRERIVAKLLSNNANTNSQNYSGYSPLHYASINGYTDIATLLIEKDANTNLKTSLGQTPLHCAIEGCYVSTASKALGDNDSIRWVASSDGMRIGNLQNEVIPHFGTGLECALTELLNQGIQISKQSVAESVSCLNESCHYCTIAKLLRSGADINEQNAVKETPLHFELIKHKEFFDINITKLLLVHDADVNKQNFQGQTALHYASRKEHSNILCDLLNKGAQINKRDTEGNTPLHLSINGDIAYILISNGADVNAKNNKGETPCHSACYRSCYSSVKQVLASGVDINQQDKDGHTALHCLFYGSFEDHPNSAKLDIIPLLTANDAYINRQNKNGETALHFAVKHMYYYSLISLLSNGANVNIQDNDGNTPFHLVLFKEVANLLLRYGGDTNIQNNKGETPRLKISDPYPFFASHNQ